MQQLFDSAWAILNIQMTYEGFTFKIWHPAAFSMLIFIIFKVLTMGGNKND